MRHFNFYQSFENSGSWVHPLAPGAQGVIGYCRVPGPWGQDVPSLDLSRRLINSPTCEVPHPFSPDGLKRHSVEEVERARKAADYGPADVPDTMRLRGWDVAADLLEFWLHGSARHMPTLVKQGRAASEHHQPLNDTIVTMKWVQGFSRGRAALKSIRKRLYSRKAKEAIVQRVLQNMPVVLLTDGCRHTFDNGALDAASLHAAWQFQYQEAGSITDPLDGMTAALGRFAVYAAVRKAEIRGRIIWVSEIGIYVRDTFDFSGTQALGCWSTDGVSRFGWGSHCVSMSNASFEDYRQRTNRGMDFLVYSDVLVEKCLLMVEL